MTLSEGINTKKKSSLFDIQLKTNKMKIHGFHKLKLTYIRVIRHYGVLAQAQQDNKLQSYHPISP